MKQGWKVKPLDEICNVEYGTRVVRKRDGGRGALCMAVAAQHLR